jgi:chromosome segregation ATPase
MIRIALIVILFAASHGLCQTPPKQSDALQALLVEVHRLRQDIEAMTIASQRVQIALHALEMQDAAVARSSQRLDAVRSKCAGADTNRQHTAADVQRLEAGLASGTASENEGKVVREHLAGMKSALEEQTAQAQACQVSEAEASNQLRNDQAALGELRGRIERLDNTLAKLGSADK